jgi:hypothetical protein
MALSEIEVSTIVDHLIPIMKASNVRICVLSISITGKMLEWAKNSMIKIPKPFTLIQALVDKFADGADKVRDSALQTSIQLFVILHNDANKSEQLIGKVEQLIRMKGFGSKSYRAKEAACLFIQGCFQKANISLKPFICDLVSLLEDANETVRATAKNAIIQLSEECQSSAMRNDISKELEKQRIRSSISESIMESIDRFKVDSVLPESESAKASSPNSPVSSKVPAPEPVRVSSFNKVQ